MRALILILLVLVPAASLAQPTSPTADDKAAAKQAFQRAEAAERKKDWRTAIDEYQIAYDRVPHPDVLFNIAVNLERLEEYRDAATFYRRYLDDKDDAADRERVERLIDKLRARPGEVSITSDPPGARVTVDGRPIGRTPLAWKTSGTRTLIVDKDGVTQERTITVEFGEPQTVEVRLVARAGTLVVRSNVEGATVTIDDQEMGKTPLEVPLPQGSHRVVVTAEGWSTYDRSVEIHPEGTTQMTANLVRPLGYVPPEVPEETTAPRGFFAIGGGADTRNDLGAFYSITFGVHRGRFEYSLGYGFAAGGAAFVLDGRFNLTQSKIRPYVRANTWLGSGLASVSAHAGIAASLGFSGSGRYSVYVDAGIGTGRSSEIVDEMGAAEQLMLIPILGGMQLSY